MTRAPDAASRSVHRRPRISDLPRPASDSSQHACDRMCGPRGMMHVPLGTLEVRCYLQAEADDPLELPNVATDFPTVGPSNRD